jgi:hypothetical protein
VDTPAEDPALQPGNPAGSHLHAQRWLFQTLTGSPVDHAHPALAPASAAQYGYYQRFRWSLLPAEADLLHQRARELLDEHRIDETVQWSPQLPAEYIRALIVPGPDPGSITPEQVQRLAPTGAFSIARLARSLDDQFQGMPAEGVGWAAAEATARRSGGGLPDLVVEVAAGGQASGSTSGCVNRTGLPSDRA